jgi:hypothetical protein
MKIALSLRSFMQFSRQALRARNYRLSKCWADGFAAGGKKNSKQIMVIE